MGLVGKIALGIVGAVIGYYTGGLGFVLMGAALGYGVGEMIDPTRADVPSIGEPKVSKLDVTTCEEGLPIPDVVGTQKVVGNIFWYDGARSEEITEEVESGGKGGGSSSEDVTVGWKYYLTWAVGLCIGPVDELLAVYRFDTRVWNGNLLNPVSGGVASVSLEGMGSMTLHFGTTDQPANAVMGAFVGANANPSLRGFCYVVFNDCLLGDWNRAPTMKFVFRKTPAYSFNAAHRIGIYDYNPAHALYHIMITMLGLPPTWVNETSFSDFADALAKEDEQRGMSILFDSHKAALNYVESILTHIGGMIYYGTDGKWHAGLLRDDVDRDDMIEIVENDIVKPMTLTPNTYINTLNDIKVQYAMRFDGPNPAPGYPDVYAFSFCDESVEYLGSGRPYVLSGGGEGLDWPGDYAAAQVTKTWLRTGSRWIGFMGHIANPGPAYEAVWPNTISEGDIDDLDINYFRVPYSPDGDEAIDEFLDNLPPGGYRPGSWFILNRDITGSNDATQLANGAAQIANLKQYLIDNGYVHTVYEHDETLNDERWLNWLMTTFTY